MKTARVKSAQNAEKSLPEDLLGGGIRVSGNAAVEAQTRVTLFEEAVAAKSPGGLRQIEAAAVLGDNDGLRGEEIVRAEEEKHAEIVFSGGVGRIEENEIERHCSGILTGDKPLEGARGFQSKNRGSGAYAKRIEIAADESGGWRMIFDEDNIGGTSAQSFDTDGAGPSKEIEEARAGYVRAQDVE